MATTTFLTATKLEASQSQKEVSANAAFDIFDKAIAGQLAKTINSADVTLTTDEARNAIISLSGTLTGNRNLIVPAVAKIYVIRNNTSGSYTVTVKTPSGTGVVVTQGTQAIVYCDGTNVLLAQSTAGVSSLDDLSDVVITSAASGQTPEHNGTNWVNVFQKEALVIAASDESTALTTGTAKVTFRMPFGMTLTEVRASLVVAQGSGSIFTVDINEAGSTILSTKLTIDNSEKTSTTAATPAVISDAALADDAEITIDIDQVGDGTAKGLKIALIGRRTA